ncbi:sigma-54-dependent Fis family transcriptional regulator [Candidatus Fermentibacteria bacterium]|nr:sigma-54-dependent Fis family transcriptional regulator [Candidatus Fermentibacteria bacterium]
MSPREAVIIDNSLDGACAGAAYLLEHPGARVFVSSAYTLPVRLINLPSLDSAVSSVAICGIGCTRPPLELATAMKCLTEQGRKITWFLAGVSCTDAESAVARLCRVRRVEKADTLTGAVLSSLRLSGHPRAAMLQSIAGAGRAEKLKDAGAKTVAELVVASIYRYFQLGDGEVYPAAVRKLAGLSDITEADLKMVARYRAMGHLPGPDGASPCIREVRRLIRLYGPLDSLNVLILGETGTGKERVARLLHQEDHTSRSFMAVNCAVLSSSDMLDSRLFGHVKGAFTGAISDHDGVMGAVDHGTLFLDKIGEMPAETQAKLLRVIEDGTFTRLGSNVEQKVDVRVIAATNSDLAEMVRNGRFRIDLYYRLRELVIRIPPLRDRLDDLGHIVGSIRRSLVEEYGDKRRFKDLSKEQYALLKSYSWPGNIRQLHSVLRRAYLLGVDEYLEAAVREEMAEGLDELINRPSAPPAETRYDFAGTPRESMLDLRGDAPGRMYTLRQVQIRSAMKALEMHKGNLTATAKALGISVNTLKKLRNEAREEGLHVE